MPDVEHPFSESDFDEMEKAIADSAQTEAAIKKAQSAGIEVGGLLDDVRKTATRIRRILEVYRPRA